MSTVSTRQTLLDRDAKLSTDYEAHQLEMALIAAERNGIAFCLNLMQDEAHETNGAAPPKPTKPRAKRRGKAEMEAARNTLAAAKAEGLIEDDKGVTDPLEIPNGLRR